MKVLEGLVEAETDISVFFVWEGRFDDSSDPCKGREGFAGWATGAAEVTGTGVDDGVPPILREMVGAGRGTSVCSGLSSGGGGGFCAG